MGNFQNIRTGQVLTKCEYYDSIKDVEYTCCDQDDNVWIGEGMAKTDYQWQQYWLTHDPECSDSNVPVNTVLPTIVNLDVPLVIGSELAVSNNGTWTSDTGIIGYEYQWFRNGVEIVGETTPSYIVSVSDTDAYILCKVRAEDSDGWSLWASSNQILVPLFWGISGGVWGTATNNVYA